jgi:hypothetical protein
VRRFFENQALVAKAKFWGLGTTGIVLSLKGDPTKYLLANDGDWFKETHFRGMPDTLDGWMKGKDEKRSRVYVIDCP